MTSCVTEVNERKHITLLRTLDLALEYLENSAIENLPAFKEIMVYVLGQKLLNLSLNTGNINVLFFL